MTDPADHDPVEPVVLEAHDVGPEGAAPVVDPPAHDPAEPTPTGATVLEPLDEPHRLAYLVLNATTAPVWLAMILAPRSRLTAQVVRLATPLFAGLGVAYTALLAAGVARGGERLDFSDPDSVRRALASPDAFLAGWTHYLAFDLFVGRWIWQESLAAGRRSRAALFLTWMAGPIGLTIHLAQRRRWR
ncbi:MAG: ABA4-like family protein [Acidimicrobiales bacterium]